MDVSSDENCTPPDISEAADAAVFNLLPKKSRDKYEAEYGKFKIWCDTKKVHKSTENVLLAYFASISKVYKASSIWSKYSMIKAVILVKENVDISRFPKLLAFLKRNSEGYKPKKSKVFTKSEINKFMLEAPDKDYLLMKVVAIMGVAGACRRQELISMTVDDIQDLGSTILVKIPFTKNKCERVFTINSTGNTSTSYDPIDMFRRYVAFRPKDIKHNRLFIFYKNFKCTVQPIGLHTMGKIPAKIAQYLGLEDSALYTGHCFRRCSATFLADSGANLTTIKRHGGWKSSSVAEGYLEDSIENKKRISTKIFSRECLQKSSSVMTDIRNVETSKNVNVITEKSCTSRDIMLPLTGVSQITNNEIADATTSGMNINNCSNFNIHIHVSKN